MSYEVEIKEVQESRNHTYFALRLVAGDGRKAFLCRVDQDEKAAAFIAYSCKEFANAHPEDAAQFMGEAQ